MKKVFLTILIAFIGLSADAQLKNDGTPDMRYNSNKQVYGSSSSTPSYNTPRTTNSLYQLPAYYAPKTTERNYDNGGQPRVQSGYLKNNGTYVLPHLKTTPDNSTFNNLKPKN